AQQDGGDRRRSEPARGVEAARDALAPRHRRDRGRHRRPPKSAAASGGLPLERRSPTLPTSDPGGRRHQPDAPATGPRADAFAGALGWYPSIRSLGVGREPAPPQVAPTGPAGISTRPGDLGSPRGSSNPIPDPLASTCVGLELVPDSPEVTDLPVCPLH